MPRIYKLHAVPTCTQYADGLDAIRPRMSAVQLRLLQTQYSAIERTSTASELARAARVEGGYPVVNTQYGRLGRMFCEETGFDPDVRPDGTFRWWAVWSLGYNVNRRGFVWVMLPEVAEALEMLGWVGPPDYGLFPEEVHDANVHLEGAVRQVTVNAYERNRDARRCCIEQRGTVCCICEINFGDVYGEVAEGFIHVHHVRPLSEIGREYVIDPSEDLRPVCPNCHAVLHRRIPAYSIEEVRSFLESNRKTSTAKTTD